MKLEDTIKAYRTLIQIYSLEAGERAVKIRDLLEKIRKKLYEIINRSYLAFVHENSSLNKSKFDEMGKKLSSRRPFHWKIDFENVFEEGGFDVIVGNPPYIEDGNYDDVDLEIIKCLKEIKKGKKKKIKGPLFYHSKDCGNTHAYFIERSIKLLKQNGAFGFIVPIALVSTDRIDSIREYIHNNSFKVKYYNFDDRPGKIFSGLEDCRSTIVVTQKGRGVKRIGTTKYHRWYSKDRPELFKNLKTIDWNIETLKKIVPKIGTKTEKKILNKLKRKACGKTISVLIKNDGVRIWYHNAPRYWIHAHTDDCVPMVEYYEGYKENSKITGKKTPYNLKETKISAQ